MKTGAYVRQDCMSMYEGITCMWNNGEMWVMKRHEAVAGMNATDWMRRRSEHSITQHYYTTTTTTTLSKNIVMLPHRSAPLSTLQEAREGRLWNVQEAAEVKGRISRENVEGGEGQPWIFYWRGNRGTQWDSREWKDGIGTLLIGKQTIHPIRVRQPDNYTREWAVPPQCLLSDDGDKGCGRVSSPVHNTRGKNCEPQACTAEEDCGVPIGRLLDIHAGWCYLLHHFKVL